MEQNEPNVCVRDNTASKRMNQNVHVKRKYIHLRICICMHIVEESIAMAFSAFGIFAVLVISIYYFCCCCCCFLVSFVVSCVSSLHSCVSVHWLRSARLRLLTVLVSRSLFYSRYAMHVKLEHQRKV